MPSTDITYLPSPVSSTYFIPPGGGFNASRASQSGNQTARHNGLDLAVAINTPVTTPLAGTVVILTSNARSGTQMQVIHSNGYTTGYAHLNSIIATNGESVSAGQLIAYSGDTGDAAGHPHLHFTLRVNGIPVDPWPYLQGNNNAALQNQSVQYTPESTVKQKGKDYSSYITVESKYINTLQKFVDQYSITMSPTDLLNYKNNAVNILNAYSTAQKYANNNQASINLLVVGTRIQIPLNMMMSNNPYRVNQTLLVGITYNTFIEAEIAKLIKDPKYKRLDLIGTDPVNELGAVYKKINQASIWVWSRLISPNGRYLVDISPFIKNINIGVTKDGGNFSIDLGAILFNDVTQSYENTNNNLNSSPTQNLSISQLSDLFQLPIISIEKYHDKDSYGVSNFVSKNSSHTIEQMNTNDFKLEPPQKDSDISNNPNYFKLKKLLFHHIIQNNDVIFIRLEKLEIDSENYLDLKEGYTLIDSKNLSGKVFDMIGLVDGAPITLDGVHNKQTVNVNGRDLSKLLLDDGVFFFPVEYEVQNKEQIIKNSSKSKSGNRLTIPLPATGNYNGNAVYHPGTGNILSDTKFNFDVTQTLSDWLLFIFQQLTNIVICPNGLFNSYPDKTFIVSRNTNFAPDGSFGYNRIAADGIWQVVKLVLDPNISERRIADSSLATDTGSLLNLVRKVCQEPFAEFTADTWGDKFYFTLRKPPWVSDSFKTNKVMNVFDYDVINSSLDFSHDFYSWYRITPMGSLIDTSDGTMMIQIPAVLLPQYCDMWGTKILDIQTNYLDWGFTEAQETATLTDSILKQASEDLDWLIEAHAYLPFSRTGSITIKADRTIKRGMCIRYFPTGEVFLVDGVSNTRSFEAVTQATTTLQVSRGIVESHFDKYFNIVNLKKNGVNKDTWTVNQDIFNFFVSRQQFVS